MYPILFRIPYFDVPIYSYGLMMVIGFLAGIQLAKYLAKRCGLDPELFVNAGLIALVAGIAGARLSHVLENIHQYTDPNRSIAANFMDAINIRSGGLTYYGGFLLAFPSMVFYGIKKKVPVRLGMDIIAPCLVIGLGFGRIGCFLNGCCYGAFCDKEWAAPVRYPYHSLAYEDEFFSNRIRPPSELIVRTPTGARLLSKEEIAAGKFVDGNGDLATLPDPTQTRLIASETTTDGILPAQIYSALTAFLIAGISLTYFTLPHAPGRGFALMLLLEGSTRYILEMLRVEPPVIGEMSLSMVLGAGLAALGLLLWIVFGLMDRPRRSPAMPLAA